MKITIPNLTIDFSLESENKLSPEHQEHSAYESELEGVIKKLSTIVDEKEKELSELRALCDAQLHLELQGYLDEIGNLKTELRDAKSQIETLKSMLIAEPSPVAKDPEGTTSPSPVAEALEATTTPIKKQILGTCKVCGKTFGAKHNRIQFCSDECRAAYKKQKQSNSNVSVPKTPVVEALEATTKKTKNCTECGAQFQPSSNRQMRCSACGIKKKSRKNNSEPTRHQKK